MTEDLLEESAAPTLARVLVFEDDPALAPALERLLRRAGFEVTLCDHAAALPANAELLRYDVILSDVRLADGSSGHDLLAVVRGRGDTIPVVLMTAFPDAEGAMRAVLQGAFDYVVKPFAPAFIIRVLRDAVTRREGRSDHATTGPAIRSAPSARAKARLEPGVSVHEPSPKERIVPRSDATLELAADWPTLEQLQQRYIRQVLSRAAGNKTRAAKVLGIDRRTINRIFEREQAVPLRKLARARRGACGPR